VKIRVRGEEHLAVGEGVGPIDALDQALRRAIQPSYPEADDIVLKDYRVRIINAAAGTDARVCVVIESENLKRDLSWGTVGASENLIEASWAALRDSIIYGIWKEREAAAASGPCAAHPARADSRPASVLGRGSMQR
jgi:2-isopropylmalate synthase